MENKVQTRYIIRIIFSLLVGMLFILFSCGGGGDGGSKTPPAPNPLDTWHLRLSSQPYLTSIAYGNGLFVVGGIDGLLTSTDGKT